MQRHPHPWFSRTPTPRVLAHRGLVTPADAADGIVENTFAAFAAALAAGTPYVESDCHVTSDGSVVLFHDDDLMRIADDPRTVAGMDVRTLSDIMSARGGLLTLRDALDAFPEVRFNLDVKVDAAAGPVGKIAGPHADRVLITSFSDRRRLQALQTAARYGTRRPATSAGSATIARLLTAVTTRAWRRAARILSEIDAVQVPERQRGVRIVTPRFIEMAHRSGVEVHVWTVNEPHDMTRLIDLGVDGLVTDRADVALRLLRQ